MSISPDRSGGESAIDYTTEDFTRIGETFDALLDAVGKTTYLRCRRLLKPGAMFVGTDMGPWGQTLLLTMWRAITGRRSVTVPIPKHVPGFVDFLRARMEAGEFRAVIDRRYPLEGHRRCLSLCGKGTENRDRRHQRQIGEPRN
ncbi:MAG: zinc-binding dehydrogenase [Alphaproteobacteria bacterium]